MTPRRAMTMFLLAISTTAAAQVLDDDLEFENHVATIVLDENSPVIEGVGPSREITYECHFEGALYLSVMADAGVDPILRIEDLEGKRVAQDDDSGGGKHAFVRLQVKGGETLVCRVAVKGRARAGIRFKLFEAKESEVTRAAAAEGVRALAEARRRRQAGELDDARKCLRRAVTALQAVPGGDASTLVADILWDIGFEAWQQLGDLAVARDALAQTEANRESILPSDHPDLQRVRLNLALMYKVSGDLAAGRELEEKALEACSRTLPEEHPDLLRARSSLAATMLRLGDLEGARVLQEKVLAARLRTLPDDHDDLQRARGNLAETIKRLGDLRGARALDEKVLEVYSRTLPDDHPDLQTARSNLATTIAILGDLPGARVLLEKVFDVCSRRFPDDHPDLQRARFNLAAVMYLLGNLQGARELFEKVFDVCSHTLPDDHPDLQGARLNLAAWRSHWATAACARAIREGVRRLLAQVSRRPPRSATCALEPGCRERGLR
ncbi:MAG: tetratricopeptide repeat protein [Planctomycetota bacterium]